MVHTKTLVTGATGFLGHYIVAELLHRRQPCVCLIRNGKWDLLCHYLRELGVDVHNVVDSGLLTFVEGELPNSFPETLPEQIGRVIHVAGSTRFQTDTSGDPAKTNDYGTQKLLQWISDLGIREFHAVSTAYVCGTSEAVVFEQTISPQPLFHNDYEQSKWRAEAHVEEWVNQQKGVATVYRPSIIVGEYNTGRATKFAGPYLACRAGDFQSSNRNREHSFRVEGAESIPLNIVPVDYVASFIAEVAVRPELQGTIYNLTHPDPPSHGEFRKVMSQSLGIRGMQFIEKGSKEIESFNRIERCFRNLIKVIRPYMVDSLVFDRTNSCLVENVSGITCPKWDSLSLHRLIEYGKQANWGVGNGNILLDDQWSHYFEYFLPNRIQDSEVAKMAALTVIVQFVLSDILDGSWVCEFVEGELVRVTRGSCEMEADFTFQTTSEIFKEIVAGRSEPQDAFLDGDVDISGNIEQGMKMGEILRRFIEEFPYIYGEKSAEQYA